MTEETTEKQYWHFSTDPQGDWLAEDGTRYTANAAAYWVTPQGLNVGCPYVATEKEAGSEKGYLYNPIPDEYEEHNIENENTELL